MSGAMSGAVSAQHPVNHPGNSRDMSRQLAGNISTRAGECPRQSSHDGWQMTSQLPPQSAQHPGSIRLASGQWTGNGRAASEPMPANVRHNVRSRVQSMTSPQSVRNRDRSQSVVAQFPRSIRRGVRRSIRATSGQLPGNVRDVSGQLAGSVPQDADECPHHS